MRPLETDKEVTFASAQPKDTICALATAHGLGAISVIRISGPQAVAITRKLAAFLPEEPESHKIYYGFLKDPADGAAIDEVLAAYFAQGRSFTGEESFEISCHGSQHMVERILRALIGAGARPARRGEFTYRAYMNGRLDLVQAESVLALIESQSTRAAQLALRQLKGELSSQLKKVLDRVLWVNAHLEASIDFSHEDIDLEESKTLAAAVEKLIEQVGRMKAGYRQGRLIREGLQVALIGRPNAGKSSLLNALANEERAIVTPIAGTTRDFVEAQMEVEGFKITLVDTAGLRVTDDTIEKIGVERTLGLLDSADVLLYVVDSVAGIGDEDRAFFSRIPWAKTVFIVNKSDLNPRFSIANAPAEAMGTIAVSAATRSGLEDLKSALSRRLKSEAAEDSALVSNARHFRGLEELENSLHAALPHLREGASPDLVALELQPGVRALHEILGLTYDDQVMDRVFAEFCLGK